MASPTAERGAALPTLGPHGQAALNAQASLPRSVMGVVVSHRRSPRLQLPDFSVLFSDPRLPSEALARTPD